eukprot:4468293-Pleurochrysis_carterae.AAC.4
MYDEGCKAPCWSTMTLNAVLRGVGASVYNEECSVSRRTGCRCAIEVCVVNVRRAMDMRQAQTRHAGAQRQKPDKLLSDCGVREDLTDFFRSRGCTAWPQAEFRPTDYHSTYV